MKEIGEEALQPRTQNLQNDSQHHLAPREIGFDELEERIGVMAIY
jgi:hypothetical protein